jgi:hypothetical protein
MAVTFKLKETLKMLVLAPAGAGLAYIATDILAGYSSTLGTLTAQQASSYSLIASGIVFAILIVMGLDDALA